MEYVFYLYMNFNMFVSIKLFIYLLKCKCLLVPSKSPPQSIQFFVCPQNHTVRFPGALCYATTFMQIDPVQSDCVILALIYVFSSHIVQCIYSIASFSSFGRFVDFVPLFMMVQQVTCDPL